MSSERNLRVVPRGAEAKSQCSTCGMDIVRARTSSATPAAFPLARLSRSSAAPRRRRLVPRSATGSRAMHSTPRLSHLMHCPGALPRLHDTLLRWQTVHARLRSSSENGTHSRPSRVQRMHGRTSEHAVFDERQCWHACFMVRLVLPSGSAAPEVRSSRPVVQLSPGAVAPQSAALPSAEMAIRGTPCCADSSRAVPHSSKVELRLSSRMQCAVAQLSALRTARSSRKPPSAEAGASRASANGIRSSCSLETTVEVAEESSL
mmetsp:Transcript_37324/g.90924  ORF Transcript_37324/g.90924 Transcript_37324/m.90924 type:complete len:262 (+) Transcript_37324:410-1195(+)